MRAFKIRPEYIDGWNGGNTPVVEIVTEADVDRLAAEWRRVEDDETAAECKQRLIDEELEEYDEPFFSGDTIKALRTAAGMSQQELGEACGARQVWIARIENGNMQLSNITFANAYRLSQALGRPMEDLIINGKRPDIRRFMHCGEPGEAIRGRRRASPDGVYRTLWTISWNGMEFHAEFRSDDDLDRFLGDARAVDQQLDEACHCEFSITDENGNDISDIVCR